MRMYMFFALAIIMPNFFLPERRFKTTVISSFMIDIHIYDESALGLSSKTIQILFPFMDELNYLRKNFQKRWGKKFNLNKNSPTYMLLAYT